MKNTRFELWKVLEEVDEFLTIRREFEVFSTVFLKIPLKWIYIEGSHSFLVYIMRECV